MSKKITETLYLVWNPNTGYPKFRHSSRESAIQEAKRLAGNHPGQPFYVLEAIGCAVMQEPVQWLEAEEIPF